MSLNLYVYRNCMDAMGAKEISSSAGNGHTSGLPGGMGVDMQVQNLFMLWAHFRAARGHECRHAGLPGGMSVDKQACQETGMLTCGCSACSFNACGLCVQWACLWPACPGGMSVDVQVRRFFHPCVSVVNAMGTVLAFQGPECQHAGLVARWLGWYCRGIGHLTKTKAANRVRVPECWELLL
eukprot:1158495-Pelagomonas_calceolata.AAC.14